MGLFRSSSGLHFNPLWHSLSILLTFVSFLMLMVVVFYNAPLDHVESTLQGKVEFRMWLLTINETTSDYPKLTTSNKRWYNASEDEAPGGGNGLASHSVDIAERGSSSGTTVDSGLHAYGFGIWGWCQWTSTDWTGVAKCTKKIAYTLPDSADSQWDSISELELPDTVAKAISGVAIPLILTPFLVFSYLVILLLAISFPKPYPPWPVPRKYPDEVKKSYKTRCAWYLRDWRWNLGYFTAMMALSIWAIVWVLVGRQKVNSKNDGLKAQPGTGFSVLLGAWVCWVLAQFLCMWSTGLIVNRGKERTHLSKG